MRDIPTYGGWEQSRCVFRDSARHGVHTAVSVAFSLCIWISILAIICGVVASAVLILECRIVRFDRYISNIYSSLQLLLGLTSPVYMHL